MALTKQCVWNNHNECDGLRFPPYCDCLCHDQLTPEERYWLRVRRLAGPPR